MTNPSTVMRDMDPAEQTFRGPMYRTVLIHQEAELRCIRVDVRDLAAEKGTDPWIPFCDVHTPMEALIIIKSLALAEMAGTLPDGWSATPMYEFDSMGNRIGGTTQ